MRFLLAVLALVLLPAAPLRADLIDIQLQETADGGILAIRFTQSPRSVTVTPDASGAAILFEGIEATPRELQPVTNSLLGRITVTRLAQGVVVRLDHAGSGWSDIEAVQAPDGALIRIIRGNAADSLVIPPSQLLTVMDSPASPTVRVDGDVAGDPSADSASASLEPDNGEGVSAEEPGDTAMTASPPSQDTQVSDAAAQPGASAPSAGCTETGAAVEADSWNLDALTAHAACLEQQGQYAEARPLLERVLAFEPARYEAALMLAQITEASGDSNAALVLYEQAAEVARTDGQAAAARARARAIASGQSN